MSRWIYGWILFALGVLVVLAPACDQFSKVAEKSRKVAQELTEDPPPDQLLSAHAKSASRPVLNRTTTEIIIGSFNIKRFGVSQMSNPKTMRTLVDIARQFDVLAIQEITSKNDQTLLQRYVEMINANGSRYSYVLSPTVGSDSYVEQYGFIFDTHRIELLDEGFLVPDPHDLLNREPMFSRFRTRTGVSSQSFTFGLANVHVAPNETRHELTTLYEVYLWLQSYLREYEDDIILLGDFNEPPRRYGQLWQIETLAAALPEGIKTNTRGTESYDNILFDRRFTHEYTNQSGVIDFRQQYGLTLEEALDVSDHLPVWAAFSVAEIVPANQFARQPVSQGR